MDFDAVEEIREILIQYDERFPHLKFHGFNMDNIWDGVNTYRVSMVFTVEKSNHEKERFVFFDSACDVMEDTIKFMDKEKHNVCYLSSIYMVKARDSTTYQIDLDIINNKR